MRMLIIPFSLPTAVQREDETLQNDECHLHATMRSTITSTVDIYPLPDVLHPYLKGICRTCGRGGLRIVQKIAESRDDIDI